MQETMLQEVMTAPREIRFDRVPVPTAGPGQVLVKIKRIGICGSDIHVYHGKHPYTKYPVTQGHEVSGQVAALGEGVTQFQVGQRVTIEPQVTALPAGMSYDEGAMLEPLAVTVHAARRAGDVAGKKVCVLGCGPIGILLVQSLKAFGAAEVMATDISDYRLELARTCGADYAVNTKTRPFGAALTECFGPDKADIIYDCAGNDTTMDQAIQNARKGSVIILVAVYAGLAHCDLAKLNDSELDLNTTMMYRHEDYVDAIRFVREGMVQLQPLMSRHFAFTDYLAAYEYIDTHQETTMKVLIDVDPSDD